MPDINDGKITIMLVNAFAEDMEPDVWHDDLLMCPSQCYYATTKNGINYVLYLRWRWDDPWQGHIITNATNETTMSDEVAVWSEDVLAAAGLHITHDDLQYAKDKLTDILWIRINGLL